MSAIYRFLFPLKPDNTWFSLFLLALRVFFGLLLLMHGIQKWTGFSELSPAFPDPLSVGNSVSLGLAIFAEIVCSIAFIFGFLYRLVLIPMIFTMGIVFFVIHGGHDFAMKELAFIYMVVFILLYLIGPGKFAFDRIIAIAVSGKDESKEEDSLRERRQKDFEK